MIKSSTFTSAVVQHSRQHDADFRRARYVRILHLINSSNRTNQLADDIHLASSGWPAAQWWKQLNDPQLDALINGRQAPHTLAEGETAGRKRRSPRPIC